MCTDVSRFDAFIYIHLRTYIYIYIYREREREIYTYSTTLCESTTGTLTLGCVTTPRHAYLLDSVTLCVLTHHTESQHCSPQIEERHKGTNCHYSTLHCTLLYPSPPDLYYTIRCCSILYYTRLCYAMLYCTVPYDPTLYYTTLCYAILYYTIPYYTISCCNKIHDLIL